MRRERDTGRNAVYGTEDVLGRVLDQGGSYDFYGSVLDMRADEKFASIAQARFYVDVAWGMVGMVGEPPAVRQSKGSVRAEYTSGKHEIALPAQSWSMRALVVVHEISHAILAVTGRSGAKSHGQEWRKAYVDAVRILVSPEAALVLQDGFYHL